MVIDGLRVRAAPGTVLLDDDRIVGAGRPESIGEITDAAVLDCPDSVVLPPLVNAHTHLDLTHIGPIEYDGSFVTWIDRIRGGRHTQPDMIAASVRRGVDLLRAGGTGLVGDISGAGSVVPLEALRQSGLPGVSYLEVFGQGARQQRAFQMMRDCVDYFPPEANGVRLGLQPHSPYSCGPEVYRWAARSGLPMATHLAETKEEILFAREAAGPLAEFLRNLGVWDETIRPLESHPVEALDEILNDARLVAAHVNYADDHQIAILSGWRGLTVAYCPRASAYFGHCDHCYRDMMEAGINVALGTDSIACLDRADRVSVLDDMRLLFHRDSTPADILMRMATVNGARALGFPETLFSLGPGSVAGLIAVSFDPRHSSRDPFAAIMRTDTPPRWIAGPFPVLPDS